MLNFLPKPVVRHPLRRYLGKQFFILKRKVKWYFGGQKFAKPQKDLLPAPIFQHQTPLLRRLKDVDMHLQYNKITNLRLALERINRTVIHPGETFSLWYLVGKPTRSKGFLEGLVLESGKIKKGIGGGLCQLGNLIYWMTLHSPLTVTERWRHSYDVFPDEKRVLPFGSGATLAYNYIDLQITNNTPEPYQLHLWLTDTDLHGEIRAEKALSVSYEIYEKEHFMRHEPWGGYSRHNRIFRKTKNTATNELLSDEPITENHALMMYQPFLPG